MPQLCELSQHPVAALLDAVQGECRENVRSLLARQREIEVRVGQTASRAKVAQRKIIAKTARLESGYSAIAEPTANLAEDIQRTQALLLAALTSVDRVAAMLPEGRLAAFTIVRSDNNNNKNKNKKQTNE